jgi:hypothetical protein
MSSASLSDYVHPVLGTFRRRKAGNPLSQAFVRLEKVGATEIPGLGYVFEEFSISLEGVDEPPEWMLRELMHIVRWPRARIGEIEAKIFSYYKAHLDHWLEDPEELVADPGVFRSINCHSDVWKLLVRPLYINAGSWPQASIAFESVFDIEHEMHISFAAGAVCEVWSE